MYYVLWCFIIDAFNRICECKRKCDICNVMSECTKEIGLLRATTNNQASCLRQDNQERPQTHKHTLYSLTRRLYRVGALGSRHIEMWRDKCEILESMIYYSWTFIWPCVCVTYRPLVRVEVVGEAAHVGGGWRAQALRVEEWWQWRPSSALKRKIS